MIDNRIFRLSCLLVAASLISACSQLRSIASPDLIYNDDAEASRYLQVPPDLTDVRNEEQFVLPGNVGGAVGRNTLLPQFDSIRFERSGDQSWLAFDQEAESVWPILLDFLQSDKFTIAQTIPVAGTLFTQWRPSSAVEKAGILNAIIREDEAFTRVAFRLERNGSGSRLFARSQNATKAQLAELGENQDWPSSSHDPESTNVLLMRLLTFAGLEERQAEGILDSADVQAILDEAIVETTGSGSQLIIYRGFQPSFKALISAIGDLDMQVISTDDGVGRIELTDKNQPLVLELTPVHFSEVTVAVRHADGQKLPNAQETELLSALLAEIV